MQWEYKVVKATFGDSLQDSLNSLGFAGWELVSIAGLDGTLTLTGNKIVAVLKRALPEGVEHPALSSADTVAGWM